MNVSTEVIEVLFNNHSFIFYLSIYLFIYLFIYFLFSIYFLWHFSCTHVRTGSYAPGFVDTIVPCCYKHNKE